MAAVSATALLTLAGGLLLQLLAVLGWTLLTLLGLLLLLILLLLVLPLDLRFRLDSDLQAPAWEDELTGAIRWRLDLRWGWALYAGLWEGEYFRIVRSESRILGLRRRSRLRPRRPQRKRAPRRKRKKRGLDLELIWAIVTEVARFVKRLVDAFGFRFKGDLTYGFSDPSLTGWCEALRWSTPLPVPVTLHPDFQRPGLVGWTEAEGRVWGYEVAAAIWRALRNPVIRSRMAAGIRFRPLRYLLTR